MLDLHIYFGERWQRSGYLDVGMHFKATNQGCILDDNSAHPRAVQLWPLARIQHFRELCSDAKWFRLAAVTFLEKMARYAPSHISMDTLAILLRSNPIRAARGDKAVGSWLVLPYHRDLIRAGIGRRIEGLRRVWAYTRFQDYSPQVSWRLVGMNLHQFMQKDMSSKIKQ